MINSIMLFNYTTSSSIFEMFYFASQLIECLLRYYVFSILHRKLQSVMDDIDRFVQFTVHQCMTVISIR